MTGCDATANAMDSVILRIGLELQDLSLVPILLQKEREGGRDIWHCQSSGLSVWCGRGRGGQSSKLECMRVCVREVSVSSLRLVNC